jgi:hypothetical protein
MLINSCPDILVRLEYTPKFTFVQDIDYWVFLRADKWTGVSSVMYQVFITKKLTLTKNSQLDHQRFLFNLIFAFKIWIINVLQWMWSDSFKLFELTRVYDD